MTDENELPTETDAERVARCYEMGQYIYDMSTAVFEDLKNEEASRKNAVVNFSFLLSTKGKVDFQHMLKPDASLAAGCCFAPLRCWHDQFNQEDASGTFNALRDFANSKNIVLAGDPPNCPICDP